MRIGAIYTRYSTANQTENSTETQKLKCLEYASRHDIEVPSQFIFSDEEKTGLYEDARKSFQDLINTARQKRFDVLIIYDMSRGSRDVADWFQLRKEMQLLGIEMISLTEKLGDLLNAGDYLSEVVKAGMNHAEVLMYRQKSIDGKRTKAQQAQYLGGKPPFGYDNIEKKYVINPQEAEGVQKIFKMYNLGYSYSEILKALADMGLTRGKRGHELTATTINSILHNERYTGKFIFFSRVNRILHKWVGTKGDNPVVIANAIPRIISDEEFASAQRRLQYRSHNAGRYAKRDYLLTNVLVCGKCGAPMFPRTTTKGEYITSRYVCKGRARKMCDLKNVDVEKLNEKVRASLLDYLGNVDYSDVAKAVKSHYDSIDFSAEVAELHKIEQQQKNLIEAIRDGFRSEEMKGELDRLASRKKQLESYMEAQRLRMQMIDSEIGYIVKAIREEVVRLTDERVIDKLVRKYVKRVEVKDDNTADIYIGVDDPLARANKNDELSESDNSSKCWLPR